MAITQSELAKRLKVSFRKINEVINEKRSVTPDLALRLSKFFGTSSNVWMNLQANFDLWRALNKSKTEITGIEPFKELA